MLKWIKFSFKKQNIKKYWKNGKQECIPVGCILPTAVAILGGSSGTPL